jgi:hypothetical protein
MTQLSGKTSCHMLTVVIYTRWDWQWPFQRFSPAGASHKISRTTRAAGQRAAPINQSSILTWKARRSRTSLPPFPHTETNLDTNPGKTNVDDEVT